VRAQIGEGRAAGDPQQQRAQRGGKELGVDPKELGGAEMLLLLAGRQSKRAMLGSRVDEIR
jgi:DNA-binding response OmpR family regulator